MEYIKIAGEYVHPELLVLFPILWFLGDTFKETESISNWAIPFILSIVSVILSTSYMILIDGIQAMDIWTGVVQGILISALQSQGYQFWKQANKKTE